jgi:hypothetical protein
MTTETTPVQLARAAADTVRVLGHHLTSESVGVEEVYDLLGELALLTCRVPHILARVDAALTTAADTGTLVTIDDAGRRHDPTLTLTAIGAHLAAATTTANALSIALDAAHEHTAHLARPGS